MTRSKQFGPSDARQVARFSGPATFMRTAMHPVGPDVDIGLCGVPFDLGCDYRTGSRGGPAGVREASRIIRRIHPTTGVKPYDLCNVADIGDAPINPLDLNASLRQIERYFDDLVAHQIRPISVGGDHTIPLPILRALARDRPVGVLHIDAHPDTLTLPDGETDNSVFMRRGFEEGLIDPKRVVQIGLRGSRFDDDDVQFGYDVGYRVVTFDDYEEMGRSKAIDIVNEVIADGPFYVSLDIDGIDPAWAPGTGVPEIGGLSPRDVQVILRSLRGKDLVGADICEVAPCFDPTGVTCITAANFMFELLCLTAEAVANAKAAAEPVAARPNVS